MSHLKKQISLVTVTGADDSVDPKDLIDIHNKFPFVEFGLLVAPDFFGGNRWPSLKWIAEFKKLCIGTSVKVAGHICGTWVQDIYNGVWPKDEIPLELASLAKRWQLNTHGIEHKYSPEFMMAILEVNMLCDKFCFDICRFDTVALGVGRFIAVSIQRSIIRGKI